MIAKAGMIMASSAASTMGTLIATGMMRAGKHVKGLETISIREIAEMGNAAIEGIKQRGKAEIGDKTILDSLYPVVQILEDNKNSDDPLESIFKKAYGASLKGVEETKKMISKHGRASWYGEKSLGKQDPGATVGALIFKAIYNYTSLTSGEK